MTLDSPITVIPGIGSKRAELYTKLGIETVYDLITDYPRGYIDFSCPTDIADAIINEHSVVKAIVTKKIPAARIRKGLTLYKAVADDGSDKISIIIYNNQYYFDALKEGEEYIFSGKITGNFTRKEMNTPQFIRADEPVSFKPVYHLTEGLTNNMLIGSLKYALMHISEQIADTLPDDIRIENELCTLEYAVRNIHFPESDHAAEIAKKRLAFDELLRLQLGLLLLKGRNRETAGYKLSCSDKLINEFCSSLPFELTGAQTRAMHEIIDDMCSDSPMNRLVQGDVGSGKTAVAASAAFIAHKKGCQTALMAPTEILAKQHYATLSSFLEPIGVKVCCLTGSLTPKQKTILKEQIADGEYSVIVGTHALISETTSFKRLALVITDEQHRFGVNQRAALAGKGCNPHKLVMSATPIPRTLALIIYGDLDISVINELPKGRQKIETYAVTGKLRERAYNFVKNELDNGRQGYLICPAIEESESGIASAKDYANKLAENQFASYNVGLLHGKMSGNEKDKVMADFNDGKYDLLVSTTVVEVGVDVPNATVMMIESSDRFGLSQLHQLRGRVGRGRHKSYCILVTDNASPETRERLKIMTSTSDGFKISEEDLRLRGAGDFFGSRQHGLPEMKIADITNDREILSMSQNAAKKILKISPDLSMFPELKHQTDKMFSKDITDGMN